LIIPDITAIKDFINSINKKDVIVITIASYYAPPAGQFSNQLIDDIIFEMILWVSEITF